MPTFTIGEEVLYGGERYVIADILKGRPYQYRLLATTKKGTRFVWADHDDLQKIKSYTEPGRI